MPVKRCKRIIFISCVAAASFCLFAAMGYAQETGKLSPSSSPTSENSSEVSALTGLIHDLQNQVQDLNSQLKEMRLEQQRSSQESHALRQELDLVKRQTNAPASGATNPYSLPNTKESTAQSGVAPMVSPSQPQKGEDRISQLEEDQQVMDGKVNDQYQTKVESGSKYRLRLSGIVLLNLYDNRGFVNNQDFPQYADIPDPFSNSPSSFGGSLRQSQIKLEAFGPDFAGARTSADLQFDFAGGFPSTYNGAVTGLVRLRTGTIHLDWSNTSIVAGQDSLFIAPLSPTSIASIATPAFAMTGNLWSWAPQVRLEHRFHLPNDSSLLVQGGILDSLSGDVPDPGTDRSISWGEESGQPAFAARVALSRRAFGQNFTVGIGGYFGKQNWGFNRNVNGWAGTADLSLPLGRLFEFTGAFYRGSALGGVAGGIGQSVLLNGDFSNPSTRFIGLDSMGGWAQLKFKPRANFEINAAFGLDNPFAGELRTHQTYAIYTDAFLRNISPQINFIYQIRSDILFSTEYRWLHTSDIDQGLNSASHINLSLGYIF